MVLRRPLIPRSGPQTEPRTKRVRPSFPLFAVALLVSLPAGAQQSPTPLFNTPPAPPAGATSSEQGALAAQPSAPPAPAATSAGRVFCDQNVSVQPADPASVPDRYRPFVGIFSDADWNPQ